MRVEVSVRLADMACNAGVIGVDNRVLLVCSPDEKAEFLRRQVEEGALGPSRFESEVIEPEPSVADIAAEVDREAKLPEVEGE